MHIYLPAQLSTLQRWWQNRPELSQLAPPYELNGSRMTASTTTVWCTEIFRHTLMRVVTNALVSADTSERLKMEASDMTTVWLNVSASGSDSRVQLLDVSRRRGGRRSCDPEVVRQGSRCVSIHASMNSTAEMAELWLPLCTKNKPNSNLTALSAQIGHIVLFKSILQFKAKLMRKMTMLRVGNTYNKHL